MNTQLLSALMGLRCLASLQGSVTAADNLPAIAPAVPPAEGPLQYVNILLGTDNVDYGFSHGNTLPLVGTPWGMTDWSPQTSGDNLTKWYFKYNDRKIVGFRATHQPSPWNGDYGQFMILPQTGTLTVDPKQRASDYDPATSVWRPDYLRIDLPRYGVTTELTASERCGVLRLTFKDAKEGRLLIDPAGGSPVTIAGRRFQGFSKAHSQPVTGNYATYFVGELDRDIIRSGNAGAGGYVEFDTAGKPVVEVRIATSHISLEQAARNLESETRGGFESVRARTASSWTDRLKRIEVDGTDEQRKTFYTCFYRALKFPHRFHEVDGDGRTIHFSPWDGKVHEGVCYVDSGLWDTFRSLFPFYSIVFPDQYGEIVEGWLNAYREGGQLPQWPSPGGFGGMVGSHADAMIADAMVKGIRGFDFPTAYAALRKDAYSFRSKEYMELGYVPAGKAQYWVSLTLDWAYDDWCVAQAAKLLGKDGDYRELMARSLNYRKLWDPEVGFMRGKKADGSWADAAFDEFAWGGGYAESGPWQSSWAVQHDAAGLAELLGGREGLAAKLDKLFNSPATFHSGAYGSVIHEMREMEALRAGQWAQSNQPSYHHPYLYAAAGQPWKTEFWTRKACAEFYNSGPQGYIGDEDNGASASWYLLSSMGFYPLTPGHPSYVLTSPALTKTTLHLQGGKTFVISAPGNNGKTVYVQKRRNQRQGIQQHLHRPPNDHRRRNDGSEAGRKSIRTHR